MNDKVNTSSTKQSIRIIDEWGNTWPYPHRIDKFDQQVKTIDDAKEWLKNNYESYIIPQMKSTAKDFKHKVNYPNYFRIIKIITNKEVVIVKPHEIQELEA